MEKIVNKKTNIFNENKLNNKIAKITFMLMMIFVFNNHDIFAQQKQKLIVPVQCSGNTNQKYDECAKPCEYVSSKNENYQTSSSGCGGGDGNFPCYSNRTVYSAKNLLNSSFSSTSRNSVISACKASCEIFKNQCSSYVVEIDTVKFLEAMPEIGISRVDPNLIEY